MNITFLVGNGFDLNLGLKTSYNHFLKYYIETSSSDSERIRNFKGDIEKNIETWASAELALGMYTDKFKKGKYEDFFECYDDFCKNLAEYLSDCEKALAKSEPCDRVGSVFSKALKNITVGLTPKQKEDFKEISLYALNENINYNFITFNYTSTLEFFLEDAKNGILGTRKTEKGVTSRPYRKYEREKKEDFLRFCNLCEDTYRDIFGRIYITRENIFEALKNFVLKKARC